MKKIKSGLAVLAATMVAVSVQAAMWTNNVDYTFSNVNNWTGGVFHTHIELLAAVKGTTAGNHALVDAGFAAASTNAAFGNTGIHPGAAGTAYVDIQSGGTLRAQNLQLGSLTQGAYGGNLTLKSGGSLMGNGTNANSGTSIIGQKAAGLLIVEAGAAFLGNSTLELGTNGTIKFIFGENSVATFYSSRATTGANNTLNGVIQVDLGALTNSGTYTLLDSKTNGMSGTLYTWLAGAGGSISGTGTYSSANFAVLNGGANEWTLALADGDKDITFSVTYNASYTLTGSAVGGGTVSPASVSVLSGGSADFIITASNYYRIASLTTNGTDVVGLSFNNNTMVASFTWSNVLASGALVATFTNRTTESVIWTNGPSGDMKFSTAGNWVGGFVPGAGDVFNGLKGTAVTNHALVDSAFSIGGTGGSFGNASIAPGGAGTAYVDIQSGATLKAINLNLGNDNQTGWNGDLTLKTGATLAANTLGSGYFFIGEAKSKGLVTAEAGANFNFSSLHLGTNGTMKFVFGADSVSAFNSTKSNAGGTNTLNGVIQVDLGALTTDGTYTLINGISNLMVGALFDTLSGGSISWTGTYSSANFEVLNGGTHVWTLALADGDHDITLTVTAAASSYTLTGSAGANGTVSPTNAVVAAGGSTNFVVTANPYYRILTLTTNGTSVGIFDNGSTSTNFTWSNVQADGTLAATFTAQLASDPAGTPYAWLAGYGLTNYDTDAVADQDSDGLKSWQEYIAGTDPTNSASGFKVTQSPRNTVTWSAVTGRVYSVYWSTNLVQGFTNLADNIVHPQGSYTNLTPNARVNHYQVKVRLL